MLDPKTKVTINTVIILIALIVFITQVVFAFQAAQAESIARTIFHCCCGGFCLSFIGFLR